MKLIEELNSIYDNNIDKVGEKTLDKFGKEYSLLPIFHTVNNSHIEIELNKNGEIIEIYMGKESITIPVTIKSLSRSSGLSPHPLHENLKYLSKEICEYDVKCGKSGFENYIEGLEKWINSPFANENLKAIYLFLTNNEILDVLFSKKIILLDNEGKIDLDNNKKIFNMLGNGQSISSIFVRFNVTDEEHINYKMWEDKVLYEDYINFALSTLEEKGICQITGEYTTILNSHPNKIRKNSDLAKLISAPGEDNYLTYKGERMRSAEDVFQMGCEISMKAHNALIWLIKKQGFYIGDRYYLLWINDGLQIPSFNNFEIFLEDEDSESYTGEDISVKYISMLNGYNEEIDLDKNINYLVLDGTSGDKGRISIINYEYISLERYFNILKDWNEYTKWEVFNNKFKSLTIKELVNNSIYKYASDKSVAKLYSRVQKCILEEKDLPKEIKRNLFNKIMKPRGKDKYELNELMRIICQLIQWEERNLKMILNTENNDRSYLFGRLVAVADVLESRLVNKGESGRETNASRIFSSFKNSPSKSWFNLYNKIIVYLRKLEKTDKGTKIFYDRLIDDIMSRFKEGDFSNKPVNENFILGFSNQRKSLYTKRDDSNNGNLNNEEEN